MKHSLFAVGLLMATSVAAATAQPPEPLSFFPYAVGNVWQYRSVFTNEIVFTETFTKDSTSSDGSRYVWWNSKGGYSGEGVYEIDSSNHVWLVSLIPPVMRGPLLYKLAADSGASWTYREGITACVTGIYQGTVFGRQTTIKKFEYGCNALWYGTRYLASGFGMVQWDVEPSDVYYLAGAIIDTNHYGMIVGVQDRTPLPEDFRLEQNYPNPFNPTTTIRYELPERNHVNLRVYNILGQEVSLLVDESQAPGRYEVVFDATRLPSGVYA